MGMYWHGCIYVSIMTMYKVNAVIDKCLHVSPKLPDHNIIINHVGTTGLYLIMYSIHKLFFQFSLNLSTQLM